MIKFIAETNRRIEGNYYVDSSTERSWHKESGNCKTSKS